MAELEKSVANLGVGCFAKIKIFLLALICAYISKGLSGAYMNSMLTQIERQFSLPTSIVGVISGSFEMGNLLLIIFVSYFGRKIHRPIMIGVGCAIMGLGCLLISLPHFLMGRYEYETTISPASNLSSDSFLCMENRTQTLKPTQDPADCVKEIKSLTWICVMVGNFIRGIGETPIMPLGISYIEDFAKSENSPLYIGILEAGKIIGPFTGLLLGSFCARIYVDTGSVNTDDLTITPTDTRWVGAWWIGFLICAGMNILTSIPFFFFPKTLPKEGLEENEDGTKTDNEDKYKEEFKEEKHGITKDFLLFMKRLSCNPIYMLFMLISVLQVSAFTEGVTFLPKYLEQQYGKSTADAIFLTVGGFIMKKFKITVKKAAYIAFCVSLADYLLLFCYFMMTCDNFPVAGLTTSYEGVQQPLDVENMVLADCNTRCSCLTKTWDPVCGDNGLAYMSACLAGCEKSVGTGINTVFHNCSCIHSSGNSSGNSSAVLGLCDKGRECANRLQYYLITTLINSFIYSISALPGYMVLLRCIKSEEKSIGIGLHTFCIRLFAGIPSPIFSGAMIDRTCLHWETLKCGGPGVCRMYDTNSFRRIYLGVHAVLRGSSYLPAFFVLMLVRKLQLPGDVASSEMEPVEMTLTEKESECVDVHRSPELDNGGEVKTKL
ncbi:solute carrier organic anion transporter family member 1A4-like isoform X2 [Meriones unguiculatus]|uniref:solute carrier organic anion transporter family member 1A4-like isoform X2 n=1 Tax=Meriones unguiculatus TaxID=10047 RepID=UPI00293EE510|nr:solute carrier organic anion transporter family member 1A4-like isoform X2 [Meriones unguiculatus]